MTEPADRAATPPETAGLSDGAGEVQTFDDSLRHSLKDARAYAVMMGAGETYLSAFALFLKATTPQIGLLASFRFLPSYSG